MARIDINNLPDVILVKTRNGEAKEIKLRLRSDLKNIFQSQILSWFDKNHNGFLEEENNEQQNFYEFSEKYVKDGEISEREVLAIEANIAQETLAEIEKDTKKIVSYYRTNGINSFDDLETAMKIWPINNLETGNEFLDILAKTAIKKNNYFNAIVYFLVKNLCSPNPNVTSTLIEFGPKVIPLIKQYIEKPYNDEEKNTTRIRIDRAVFVLAKIALKNKECVSEVKSVLEDFLINPSTKPYVYPPDIERTLKEISK